MTCIYHILEKGQFKGQEVNTPYYEKFNYYLERYFLLAEQTNPDELKSWAENILISLFEYSIKLAILQYAADIKDINQQKESLQQRVSSLYRRYINSFCKKGAFDQVQFISKYQDILYFERGNVNRKGHSGQNYLNAVWLAELFLEPEMVEKNDSNSKVRAAVMNLLSELVLYSPTAVRVTSQRKYGKEQLALKWLDLCLDEDPGNVYASERKKQLASFITSAEQINRFKHDAVSKIEAIRGTIKRLKPLVDSIEEMKELQAAEENIKFIINTFRLSSRENPQIRMIDIDAILNSFGGKDIEKVIIGKERPLESDTGYLLLILDNLIKNSKEAYGDSCPKKVILTFNYDTKTFIIKDYAGGIPEDLQRQDKLFEPYVSTKGIFQNAGIGLASAIEACRLINAELSYRIINDSGLTGTEFILQLNEYEED
jgi:hypothetical protein